MKVTIEVERERKWIKVKPEELTIDELCKVLNRIDVDSDEFISKQEAIEANAAINEAIVRLQQLKILVENDNQ